MRILSKNWSLFCFHCRLFWDRVYLLGKMCTRPIFSRIAFHGRDYFNTFLESETIQIPLSQCPGRTFSSVGKKISIEILMGIENLLFPAKRMPMGMILECNFSHIISIRQFFEWGGGRPPGLWHRGWLNLSLTMTKLFSIFE